MLWNSLALEHARFFSNFKSLFAEAKIISEEKKSYKLTYSYVGGVGRMKIVFNSISVQRFDFKLPLQTHAELKFLTHIGSHLYI